MKIINKNTMEKKEWSCPSLYSLNAKKTGSGDPDGTSEQTANNFPPDPGGS